MMVRRSSSGAEGKCYFTAGMQPNLESLRRFAQESECLCCNDSGCEEMELAEGAQIVFGGTGRIEGPLDLLFLRRMIGIKYKYPEKVHLLIGSREIDLLEAWVDFDRLGRYVQGNQQNLDRQGVEEEVKKGGSKIFKAACEQHLGESSEPRGEEGKGCCEDSLMNGLEKLTGYAQVIEEYLRSCRFAHYFGRTIFIHGCWNLSVCALFSNYMQTENTKGCFVDFLNCHFSDAVDNLLATARASGDVEDDLEYLRHAVRFCFKDIIPIDFFDILQFRNVVCSHSVLGFIPTIIQHDDVSIIGLDLSAPTHLLDEHHDIVVAPESCCCSLSFTEDGCARVKAEAGSDIQIRFSKCTWAVKGQGEEKVQLGMKRDNLYIISKLSYCKRQYYVYLCSSSLLVSLGLCSEQDSDVLHCNHDEEEAEEEETGVDLHNVLTTPGGGTVYLVGTAHVSSKSCEDVRKALQSIRPQIVAVELCEARRAMLFHIPPESLTFAAIMSKMKDKDSNLFSLLYSWFLSNVSTRLEVAPGEEFRVAYEESKKLSPPSSFLLIDRPVHITVARMWAGITTWEKLKLCWMLVRETLLIPSADELNEMVESLKQTDAMTMAVMELGSKFPGLIEPLMTERDQYLCYMLRKKAQSVSEGVRIVAVVGAGHIAGIKKFWEEPIDLRKICCLPVSSRPHPATRIFRGFALGATVVTGFLVSSYSYRLSARLIVRLSRLLRG
mmetsp:Transcript_44335/g.139883  ORF Transcript_44335/g.139883 Transcript_44335/m.139883 type:complete len:721 (-) Transcript_44335:1713-3875(-)